MINKPIPLEAMVVVEIIRRDVPRPEDLPISTYWRGRGLKFGVCCPMGLHPDSRSKIPAAEEDFASGQCTYTQIRSFYRWWDDQTDPQAATDAVWPKEETDA